MASAILSSIISIVGKLTSYSSSSTTADELQGDLRHLKRTLLRIQAMIADGGGEGDQGRIRQARATRAQVCVLDLSYTCLEKVLNLIGELKHLRYLALRETSITGLPESLCKLYNLQVLDLDRCENLCELPRGMKNLTELKHLKLPILEDSHFCTLRGMGNLTNLQTLSAFYIGGDVYQWDTRVNGVGNLKGELKIYGLNRVLEQNFPDLSRLRLVKKLTLYWNIGSSNKCNYGGIEESQAYTLMQLLYLVVSSPQLTLKNWL